MGRKGEKDRERMRGKREKDRDRELPLQKNSGVEGGCETSLPGNRENGVGGASS